MKEIKSLLMYLISINSLQALIILTFLGHYIIRNSLYGWYKVIATVIFSIFLIIIILKIKKFTDLIPNQQQSQIGEKN